MKEQATPLKASAASGVDFNFLRKRIQQLNKEQINQLVSSLPEKERLVIPYVWKLFARDAQLIPGGDWLHLAYIAGRGNGKTRTGAEFIRSRVCQGSKRINLIGRTAGDVRDIMIEGESGLLSVFPPHQRPKYFPGYRRVVFHTGAIGTCISADQPDQLRGPQCDTYWCDEFAYFRYIEKVWSNLIFGFRLGNNPKGILTSTGRNLKLLREILAYEETEVITGTSYDNLNNLADSYKRLIKRYEGTRLGKQEILGMILEDTVGALWKLENFDSIRLDAVPELVELVISLDPSVSDDEQDECGIVCHGKTETGLGIVFGDHTGQYTTSEWGAKVRQLYHSLGANQIVAESNNGGALVRTEIQLTDKLIPVKLVWASRGKVARAEPVHSLYEKNMIRHVGNLSELEDEMTTWVPGKKSPNRLDANVWGLTHLFGLGQKDTPWYMKDLEQTA